MIIKSPFILKLEMEKDLKTYKMSLFFRKIKITTSND